MSIDVNAAFADERADQLAAATDVQARIDDGRLIPLGGDRYRVNEPGNWDNGETLRLNRGRLVPQHGLDTTSTGEVAFYSAVPAWHGLGNVIPGGISSIDSVLKLAGIDFMVHKVPSRYEWDGQLRTSAERFTTVRDDTGADLGSVGHGYQVIQQRELFTFIEELVGQRDIVWESAGALRGGRKVFVSLRVPEGITVDPGGLDDRVELFIVAVNTHDGQSAAHTLVTPWRPVCGNTERFALRDARARWSIRHTSGALERLEEARRTLGLTLQYAEAFETEETALARTDIAIAEFHKVIDELWPVAPDAGDKAKRYADERRGQLDAMFKAEAERAGRTAYAAERTVTDYLDHHAPRKPRSMTEEVARATALIEGDDDRTKSRAHRRLMLLTR